MYKFVCLPSVDGSCLNSGCKNYHPNTPAEKLVLQQEVKKKVTKNIKMTKICTNYNSPAGCQYDPCKFIHVTYNDDVIELSQIMYISKIERDAINILTLVKNINHKISTSNPYKTSELIKLREKYSSILDKLYKELSMDITFLS